MMKPRSKRFLEELPKHGNKILPSAIEAGYTESYAKARGKTILKTAIIEASKDIMEKAKGDITAKEGKQLMSELVGISREEVMNRLKYIAEQDKDLHSALKVLSVLAKEHGVSLESDQNTVNVPILNITVDKVVKDEVLLERETNMPSEIVIG